LNVEDYIGQYPVAIVEDRYGGTYSGGRWVAIAEYDSPACDGECTRISFFTDRAGGDDGDAWEYWGEHHAVDWLAVGPTPDAALAALRAKYTAPVT
jgi:hypothetical protein